MKKIRCPQCGALTAYEPSNAFRPFCSERCKVLDLGAWADEKYAVPVQESELSSVNENHNVPDSDGEQSLNSPLKHQLN